MAHEIITQYEKYVKPYSTYSWDFQSSDQRDLMHAYAYDMHMASHPMKIS